MRMRLDGDERSWTFDHSPTCGTQSDSSSLFRRCKPSTGILVHLDEIVRRIAEKSPFFACG